MIARSEPRLITVIRRLADLQGAAFLSPSELAELNALRMELADRWPRVGETLALAYVTDLTGQ